MRPAAYSLRAALLICRLSPCKHAARSLTADGEIFVHRGDKVYRANHHSHL